MLIIKYHEKNKDCIKETFKSLHRWDPIETALIEWYATNRVEWLKAFFKLCEVGVEHYGVKLKEQMFLDAFETVFNNDKYKSVHHYQPIVQEYYNKFFPHSVDKDINNA